jgi:hypothetical protein
VGYQTLAALGRDGRVSTSVAWEGTDMSCRFFLLAVSVASLNAEPVGVVNNATTVNTVATNPGGTFFQNGSLSSFVFAPGGPSGSDVVFATNPPGIQNVQVVSGTPTTQNVVTAVNQTTAPFLTGATLNTTAGNAITGVTTTSNNAPFVNGVPVQTGNFLTSVATATTPVVNAVAAANSGAFGVSIVLGVRRQRPSQRC